MNNDVFAQVPEFLAAFDHIAGNGFFETIQFAVGGNGMEGKVSSCSIIATGCVPNKEKYRAEGCGSIIDPQTIITSCRRLARPKRVKEILTKVETQDWPLWDTTEQHKIGSKGRRTKLTLDITFKI